MPMQKQSPANRILTIVQAIQGSNGYQEESTNQEWLGPWLNEIETLARSISPKENEP